MSKKPHVMNNARMRSSNDFKLDDIFGNSSTSSSSVANTPDPESDVKEIELTKLHEFKNHPFKVIDDDKMEELVESIKSNGILMPAIVRLREDGEYELIAGHRRKYACELAGLSSMPVVVRDYTDDEATIIMVDSNIQRERLLPSEKAKAYAMKYDALKHKGVRNAGDSLLEIAKMSKEGRTTIQRYIWLARLNNDLLQLVDNQILGLVQGTDISFLTEEQQQLVYDVLKDLPKSITKAQAFQLKKYGMQNELDKKTIKALLEEKKDKKRKVTINSEEINKYFSEDYSTEEIENIIFNLLSEWKKSNI